MYRYTNSTPDTRRANVRNRLYLYYKRGNFTFFFGTGENEELCG